MHPMHRKELTHEPYHCRTDVPDLPSSKSSKLGDANTLATFGEALTEKPRGLVSETLPVKSTLHAVILPHPTSES